MHLDILTKKQEELLPLITTFSKEFGLVGGTAVALQIGHRESIDFDLFKKGDLNILKIKRSINSFFPIDSVRVENTNEYTLKVDDVQMTFYNYPFAINYSVKFDKVISIPDLPTLGAMKAFALGKRAKWKDYVDLYFIFQKHSFAEVVQKAKEIYGREFSEKLFREQLSYYKDVNYSEEVSYKPEYSKNDEEIKQKLIEISLS